MNAGDNRCFKCEKKVPWTEDALNCKCGHLFCASHRFPEDHRCTFNYHEEHKQKLIKENPRVVMDGGGAASYPSYLEAHRKQHPERFFLRFHSAGFLVFAFFVCKGLVSALLSKFILFPQQALIGYILGFAIAHSIPSLIRSHYYPNLYFYSSVVGGCRCCFFSWDLVRKPRWTVQIEQDMLLQQALDFVTCNRTNCLSYLHSQPSWSKTASAVWQKVT